MAYGFARPSWDRQLRTAQPVARPRREASVEHRALSGLRTCPSESKSRACSNAAPVDRAVRGEPRRRTCGSDTLASSSAVTSSNRGRVNAMFRLALHDDAWPRLTRPAESFGATFFHSTGLTSQPYRRSGDAPGLLRVDQADVQVTRFAAEVADRRLGDLVGTPSGDTMRGLALSPRAMRWPHPRGHRPLLVVELVDTFEQVFSLIRVSFL